MDMPKPMASRPDRDSTISTIASEVLGITALEARHSDSLDFHDLSVWKIREALEAAHDAGRAAGRADAPQ